MRRLHRWGAIACALPLLVVICTGLLLLLKKQFAWIQPVERRGTGGPPGVNFDRLLEAARGVPGPDVEGWDDIDRIEVRVGRGITKILTSDRWEVQVDSVTGEVLQTAVRRSDLIESLHDGSWFHPAMKLWVFFPSGLLLLSLWLSGMYLWGLPFVVKALRKRPAAR
jgi:uncharacterized iron-regulated membrane protein